VKQLASMVSPGSVLIGTSARKGSPTRECRTMSPSPMAQLWVADSNAALRTLKRNVLEFTIPCFRSLTVIPIAILPVGWRQHH
jgi:hypothetical protein